VWIFKRTHFAKSPKEIMNELKKHRDMESGATEGAVETAATEAK
jgi:small subunit ribosomal protein S3